MSKVIEIKATDMRMPEIGFTGRTQKICIKRICKPKEIRDAHQGESLWLIEDIGGGSEKLYRVGFFNEDSKHWDFPSDEGDYVLEQWEGMRDSGAIGEERYLFIRKPDGEYEYFGRYKIDALFKKEPKQVTLWRRF